ncbi:MAG: hypothetical protein AAF693_20275 [Bacteroidota bacterium]
MKILNFKKTIKNYTWATVLLIGVLTLGITSCSDDDGTDVDPGGQEIESAWWSSYEVRAPEGDIYYLTVTEDIPTDFNASSAVELGFEQTVIAVEDNIYVYNPSAQTITKWSVDRTDLSLSVEGILSVATTGIPSGALINPTVVSETEAYLHRLEEGIMVEWNPADMTITEVHQVEPLVPIHGDNGVALTLDTYVRGEKVIIPILDSRPLECCDVGANDNIGARVAVFDINSKILEYKSDERLAYTFFISPTDENGRIYIQPNNNGAVLWEYFNIDPSQTPSPHTLLRLNEDGSSFDPNFSFDFDDVLDIGMFNLASFVFDNKIVLSYWDNEDGELPPNYGDAFSIRANPLTLVSVDLDNGDVEPFTALDKYNTILFVSRVDGVNYFLGISGEFGNDDTHFLRQNGLDDFTELSSFEGAFGRGLGKLW